MITVDNWLLSDNISNCYANFWSEGEMIKNFRRIVIWAALFLIILLIFLSVYGAFLGSERAKEFFNSLPLSIYWLVLTILIISGLAVFHRLVCIPGLMLMHSGCIFILIGSLWASQAGHKLSKQIFGIGKIPSGTMTILKGQSQNLVTLENCDQIKELPFHIELKDFRLEYYKPEYLYVQALSGQRWKFPVETGTEFHLGDDFGTITILRTFENFKIIIDEDKRKVIDSPQPGCNPALHVQLKFPDGSVKESYVFERFPHHTPVLSCESKNGGDRLILNYRRIIQDYISDVKVVQNGNVLTEKSIEVNRPLHFGGYHFYQSGYGLALPASAERFAGTSRQDEHSYDDQAGEYSVLMVCSDSGLNLVYTGYLLLVCGAFWHFWLRHIFKASNKTSLRGPELVEGPWQSIPFVKA